MAEKGNQATDLAGALRALQDALRRAEELGVTGHLAQGRDGRAHDVASGGRHEVALEFGFARGDIDGETILYAHPFLGTLFMYGDGEWEHQKAGETLSRGSGAEALKRHLDIFDKPPVPEGSGNHSPR